MGNDDHKPVRQAFGSPGGKSSLAPKIVAMMPDHDIYVEPFAGGAAVFFKKPKVEKEILGDKDADIAFAFRFLRTMTPQQFKRLQKYDWVSSRDLFKKLKESKPKSDLARFRRFYYLKKASFASGGGTYNRLREGDQISIEQLWRIHERLKRTKVHSGDALLLIDKYDSPRTLFYIDPPYPDRAFVGQSFDNWTKEDLARLIGQLKSLKGRFILSLAPESAGLLPSRFRVARVRVDHRKLKPRGSEWNKGKEFEIVVTNFSPNGHKAVRRKAKRRGKKRQPSIWGGTITVSGAR